MSILSTLSDITWGVAEELKADLQGVAWALLGVLGLRAMFQCLIQELNLGTPTNGLSKTKRRRNLIRIIGSALPLQPVQRPYFRYVALGSLSTSCDSLFSSTTQNQVEIGWSHSNNEKSGLRSQFSLRRSSMLHASCTSLVNQDASLKIAALEEELAALRDQIASIVCKAPERPLTPPSTPTPSIPAPPPPPPPPAPPPPPPPLSLCRGASPLLPRKSFSEMILENKGTINQHTEPVEVPSSQRPSQGGVSLTEVLKGLGKVKLKRTDRSPGGTPIRDRNRSPDPMDAASLIAAALKKRFANFHADSPEKDEPTSGFSSPEGTPKFRRRSRRDDFSPPKKLITNSTSNSPQPFVLRKVSKTLVKPKVQEDKQSLPPFGQHLLKKRLKSPAPIRESPSPSSETSDLSR